MIQIKVNHRGPITEALNNLLNQLNSSSSDSVDASWLLSMINEKLVEQLNYMHFQNDAYIEKIELL